jgi:hypothetical protein
LIESYSTRHSFSESEKGKSSKKGMQEDGIHSLEGVNFTDNVKQKEEGLKR